MRVDGWEHRLADLIADAHGLDFAYGSWDCGLFAAAAIRAVTGIDVAEAFRGQYATEAACSQVITAAGSLLVLADRVAREYGWERTRAVQAGRGDIVMGRLAGQATLGVCVGRLVVFARQPCGIHGLPITHPDLIAAWRIA